jgi:hypothetical protein
MIPLGEPLEGLPALARHYKQLGDDVDEFTIGVLACLAQTNTRVMQQLLQQG